jgi:16S rRNA (guanine966-N2)-methyltransferase
MRIIAGNLKGKKLAALTGISIRPTADRIREAIFNICASHIYDAVVLDLFAGTGAFAIEALSRGAKSAVLIDSSSQSISIIKKNIEACRLPVCTDIIQWDILKNLNCLRKGGLDFDLVFMDPPYNKDAVRPTLKNLAACGALRNEALVIIEHARSESVPDDMSEFDLTDQRKYGKTLVSFLNYMVKIHK